MENKNCLFFIFFLRYNALMNGVFDMTNIFNSALYIRKVNAIKFRSRAHDNYSLRLWSTSTLNINLSASSIAFMLHTHTYRFLLH